LTLEATSATSVAVSGNAALNLTITGNTKLTSVDGSAMTGALTVTTAGTKAETVKGGSGADSLTAAAGTVADTLIGNGGADTLTSNAGLTSLTGGAGADVFVINAAGANVNVYSTITDATAGDVIRLVNQGTETFSTTALTLGDTAVFQDFANLACAGDGSTNGIISWFQFAGNTYIVEDRSAAETFVNGDVVVKLTGLVDLSTATFNNGTTPNILVGGGGTGG
jgi:S-layer protein